MICVLICSVKEIMEDVGSSEKPCPVCGCVLACSCVNFMPSILIFWWCGIHPQWPPMRLVWRIDDALVEKARDEALENLSPDEVTPMQVDSKRKRSQCDLTSANRGCCRERGGELLLQESTVAQDSGSASARTGRAALRRQDSGLTVMLPEWGSHRGAASNQLAAPRLPSPQIRRRNPPQRRAHPRPARRRTRHRIPKDGTEKLKRSERYAALEAEAEAVTDWAAFEAAGAISLQQDREGNGVSHAPSFALNPDPDPHSLPGRAAR